MVDIPGGETKRVALGGGSSGDYIVIGAILVVFSSLALFGGLRWLLDGSPDGAFILVGAPMFVVGNYLLFLGVARLEE